MRLLPIAAVLALVAALPVQAQPAEGQKPEASKAACHTAAGKSAHCPPKAAPSAAKGAPRTKVATPMITRCRDVTSHQLTKCGGPNAEPVPAN